MKNCIVLTSIFIIFISNIFASIKTQSFVDKKEVHIGDIINYTIIIKHKPELQIEPFEIYEIIKDTAGVENFIVFDKKHKRSISLFKNEVIEKYVYKLIPIQLGKVNINELIIKITNTKTNQITTISLPPTEINVLPQPKPKGKRYDGELVDIKPQIWVRNYIWVLIILIIIGAISGWIYYNYRQKNTKTVSVQTTSIDIKEVTLKKLDELWSKDYLSKKLIKEFYYELSAIVRWYIGEKYNVNALESTTEELFILLKKKVDKKYNLKLKAFLENTDLAKFAKYIPDIQQIKSDFETAKELVSFSNSI